MFRKPGQYKEEEMAEGHVEKRTGRHFPLNHE
jgi:hypothetical protein